ncbi:hypothetical protein GALMADRAFT_259275 [Galerina marginata CBS 339.88]|uniref:Zn(2)-C6 fungal-type domain-containing protein n=1 Tax=Galerina marginata (strain CBS 339.88) TaxID=685588 RepID=A0A067S980_GALM3|nr:hypothetical protein GALMADRAFT_259275 [Galerina marginata CBS 339.88]
MFRPPTRRHDFSGAPNTTQSPGRFHEAELQTANQQSPSYFSPPSTSSAPFEADNDLRYSHHRTDPDYCIKGGDVHGPIYHHGKLWESSTLQEKYDTSAWTTTSSSQWLVNHVHRHSAEIESQYPAPQYVQPLASSSATGFSSDVLQVAGDALAAPEPRFRIPPNLVPPDDIEQFFESTALPGPPNRMIMPVPLRPRPKYDAAHQPVPPEKRSSYSELSANLEYLEKLKQEEQDRIHRPPSTQRLTITIPRPAASTTATTAAANSIRLSPGSICPPSPLKKRKRSKHILPSTERPSGASQGSAASAARDDGPSNAASKHTSTGSSSTAKSFKEPRKTSLACIFCRERKISCGRPPLGSPDPTCNQCARRSFKCTYMNEQGSKHLTSTRRR